MFYLGSGGHSYVMDHTCDQRRVIVPLDVREKKQLSLHSTYYFNFFGCSVLGGLDAIFEKRQSAIGVLPLLPNDVHSARTGCGAANEIPKRHSTDKAGKPQGYATE